MVELITIVDHVYAEYTIGLAVRRRYGAEEQGEQKEGTHALARSVAVAKHEKEHLKSRQRV